MLNKKKIPEVGRAVAKLVLPSFSQERAGFHS